MRISDWSSDVCSSDLMTGDPEEDYWSAIAGLPVDQSPKKVLTDANVTDKVLSEMTASLIWGRRIILKINAEEAMEIETSRSEEHTSELQSLMRISYAVCSLKKKLKYIVKQTHI